MRTPRIDVKSVAAKIPYTVVRKADLKTARPLRRILGALGGGIVLEFFLDPRMGRTRRTRVASRVAGLARKEARMMNRMARRTGATAHGIKQKVIHRHEVEKTYDDATLQQKIKSQVLGRQGRAKIPISVDVTGGVATLRGECESGTQMRRIEAEVKATQGVRDVVNLMHRPGTPAPNTSRPRSLAL
jgi:hypothetical protein